MQDARQRFLDIDKLASSEEPLDAMLERQIRTFRILLYNIQNDIRNSRLNLIRVNNVSNSLFQSSADSADDTFCTMFKSECNRGAIVRVHGCSLSMSGNQMYQLKLQLGYYANHSGEILVVDDHEASSSSSSSSNLHYSNYYYALGAIISFAFIVF